jgi:site-specific recombinase XerD
MHALKHSCGTILAENGLTADQIQDHLGHRSSHSTDIYMHFSKRRRAELAERLRGWR